MTFQPLGTINASAPTNALIGATSSTVIIENTDRTGLILTNISDSTMYLSLMNMRATLNAGIVLTPKGGVWTMDRFNFNNSQINAIAHSANNIISIQEFIR